MKKNIQFNVNAHTARLIGRENVSNLDGAILELVKNSYDADASCCILYYDKKQDTLYLMDNGTGMNEDIIVNHWMNIGNSSKYKEFVTKRGRIQTGAKGIGRFALDRVGSQCTMYTRDNDSKDTIEWIFDWESFERNKNLTDVEATIDNLNLKNIYSDLELNNKDVLKLLKESVDKTGTIFKISKLSDDWNDDRIKFIRERLASLIPVGMENVFSIYLFNDSQTIDEAKIVPVSIDNYDYRIKFNIYDDQKIKVSIHRNEFDFKDEFDTIIKECHFTKDDVQFFRGKEKVINTSIQELIHVDVSTLGNIGGELYYSKIQANKNDTAIYYYKDFNGRGNYSKIFGGIKIYRDNFRVRPYGERDTTSYDWLLLGIRNSGAPALKSKTAKWRVASEQISGIINISRKNTNLPDQANREGIVETSEFNRLKELIIAIISLFEEDRQYVGRKLYELYDRRNPKERIEEDINKKAKSKDNLNATASVSAKDAQLVIESKNDEISELENENRMLRNLATVGILSNQYSHETKESINNIGLNNAIIFDNLSSNQNHDESLAYLRQNEKYIETLLTWFNITLNSIRKDKRSMKKVDISQLCNSYIANWKKVFDKIEFKLNIQEDLSMKCFPYEIESIIGNLIANSVEALKSNFLHKKDKIINLSIKQIDSSIVMEYSDNGNGLDIGYKSNPSKILDAFETTKRNSNGDVIGTGLGMWIISNIVRDYNGSINLEKNKDLKEGFYIKIELMLNQKEV